jgi:hypothetical protein
MAGLPSLVILLVFMNIVLWFKSKEGPIDIEDAEEVEILVREDGRTLWINTSLGCLARLCRIKGKITVRDERKKKRLKI